MISIKNFVTRVRTKPLWLRSGYIAYTNKGADQRGKAFIARASVYVYVTQIG